MSQIDAIPSLNWSDRAQEEIALAGQELLEQSDFSWRLGDAAICGLIYTTYTSPPWLWFALASGVTMRDLIDFRRLSRLIPSGTLVGIREGYETGVRFAQFYGFVATERTSSHAGRTYRLFRRV